MMTEICGPKQSELSNSSTPDTHFSKTSPACYLKDQKWMKSQGNLFHTSEQFSETWPKQGIMQDGRCWALTMWEPTTGGKGCGLWPTPTSTERNGINPKTGKGAGLWKTVTMLPTPTSGDHNRGMTLPDGKRGQSLVGAARGQKWPTPKGSPSGPDFARMNREKSGGDDLATKVAKFPTPRASESDMESMRMRKYSWRDRQNGNPAAQYRAVPEGQPGQLNPPWVEWLMNWPIGWTDLKPLIMDNFIAWKNQKDWWKQEPELPRVATGTKERANRLKAIGNGQVSLSATTAWEILKP